MLYYSDLDLYLTAKGTNQATALPISLPVSQFDSVPVGTGCILQFTYGRGANFFGGTPNMIMEVINDGANQLLVYPPSGAAFTGQAVNAAVSVAVGTAARFLFLNLTTVRPL